MNDLLSTTNPMFRIACSPELTASTHLQLQKAPREGRFFTR